MATILECIDDLGRVKARAWLLKFALVHIGVATRLDALEATNKEGRHPTRASRSCLAESPRLLK
jgi:hypothetical protein